MITGKARTVTITLLILYTVIMLYFLYFGFGRIDAAGSGTRGFQLIPDGIPLSFPIGGVTWIWFYHFANFAAFLPYGLFVPLVVQVRFPRLLGRFLITIFLLEILQWATGLGSFDMGDILTNTLGVAVGYTAQRWVPGPRETLWGIGKIIAAAALLSVGTVAAVHGVNHWIAQATSVEAGREVGIDSLPVKEGLLHWDPALTAFEAGGHHVMPQVNLFSRNNPGGVSVTYALDGKYMTISGYMGMPDDISQGESTVIISLDGGERSVDTRTLNRANNHEPGYFEMDVYKAQTLTITIRNEDKNSNTNVLLWDMIITEIKNHR